MLCIIVTICDINLTPPPNLLDTLPLKTFFTNIHLLQSIRYHPHLRHFLQISIHFNLLPQGGESTYHILVAIAILRYYVPHLGTYNRVGLFPLFVRCLDGRQTMPLHSSVVFVAGPTSTVSIFEFARTIFART